MSLHSKSNTENERMLDSDLDRASFSNAQFMLLCWYHTTIGFLSFSEPIHSSLIFGFF